MTDNFYFFSSLSFVREQTQFLVECICIVYSRRYIAFWQTNIFEPSDLLSFQGKTNEWDRRIRNDHTQTHADIPTKNKWLMVLFLRVILRVFLFVVPRGVCKKKKKKIVSVLLVNDNQHVLMRQWSRTSVSSDSIAIKYNWFGYHSIYLHSARHTQVPIYIYISFII